MYLRAVSVFASSILATGLVAGCGPSVASLRADGSCLTWVEGPFANYVARVDDQQAIMRTALGERPAAYFVSPTEIDIPSLFGAQRAGSYDGGQLTIHTVLGDHGPYSMLGETNQIPGGLTGLTVDHNGHCRPPQIALGSVSLFFAIAAQAARAGSHH
jgi:hypothetical protein